MVQYERSVENYKYLSSQTDAKGRKIKIIKLPLPPPLYYAEEEAAGVQQVPPCFVIMPKIKTVFYIMSLLAVSIQ